ncbi:MAG: T9SS type A sorting domain-containing protein [Tannerellaceae bacterium]|nr:T9SS type A sorting domain-containing protein [Tannerellaceae bacterium]
MSPVSSQTALTGEQKTALCKEILPAVVEQLDRQFGFELKALFKPEMTGDGILRSPFINPVMSRLRSDSRKVGIKPDSVLMSLAIMETPMDIKLLFQDYETVTLPDINGFPTTFELPKKTLVKGEGLIDVLSASILIAPKEPSGKLLGGFSLTLSTSMGKFVLLDLTAERLSSGADDGALYVNMDGSRDLFDLLSFIDVDPGFKIPPVNYQIDIISHTDANYNGTVDVTLFSAAPKSMIKEKKQHEVTLFMDQSRKMPVRAIKSVMYDENGTGTDWRKYWLTMEQASKDLVLTIEDYQFKDARMEGDSTHIGSTFVTMSDYKGLSQAALLNRLIAQVANNEPPASFRMTTEYLHGNTANATREKTMETRIIPYEDGDKTGGKMHLAIYSPNELKTDLTFEATASKQNERVAVKVTPTGGSTLATLYFTSNISIVGNEKVAPASAFRVAVQDGGLYISQCEKGVYSIMDMKGYTLSNGLINHDHTYVPVAHLPKGVYIIKIKENGKTHSVKFVK